MVRKMFSRRSVLTWAALSSITTAKSCCDELTAALRSNVYGARSASYTAANNHRWSETSIETPACIVVPSSAQEVSTIVKILTAGARQNATGCEFAVKSGGHNPNPGANDINSGVTVDLSLLNDVTVSSDQSSIRLGVGSTWQNAYDQVSNLSFPGGLCGDTGVGGVSIGGGMSLLLPEVGWVANNILNFEIVLANGSIVNANNYQYADLYKALKGGGSSFGIVTHVTVAVHGETNGLWAGQIINAGTANATTATIKALTDFTTANNNVTSAAVQCAFLYSSDGTVAIDNLIADTNNQANPPILQPFLEIPDQISATVNHTNMSAVAYAATNVQPYGYRDLTATLTFQNSVEAMSAVESVSASIYSNLTGAVPGMDFIVFYIPLPQVVNTAGLAHGENVLGLDLPRDRISVSLNPRWQNATYDQQMYAAARTWVSQAQSALQAIGKDDPFLYLNYAASSQQPFVSYGSQNLAFIQHTAAKYDPEGVFQSQMPGGFKVSRAS